MGPAPGGKRLVLLGASNVRLGLPTIVGTMRAAAGPDLEIFGAFGHGRSYGRRSCIPFRCLPGIRECGIWEALARRPPADAAAVITDVGNDILYGESATTILGWVSECLDRLSTPAVTITGLPLPGLAVLGRARFVLTRSILFPGSLVSRDRAVSEASEVNDGLRGLAERSGARFVPPDPAWYGADPIHIRPRRMADAWASILSTAANPSPSTARNALGLWLAAPERRWVFGIARTRRQPAWIGPERTRLNLY
jgi:hypothetical protein